MLRFAREDDAEAIAAIYAPFVRDTTTSFEYVVPDAGEMAARWRTLSTTHPWIVWDDGGIQGYAYAGPHRSREAYQWSTEVSVYLAPEARGRGLGSQLYQALFRCLRAQGFVRAWAGVTLPNPASERLHTKLGFRLVGIYEKTGFKNGVWRDVAWYGLGLQDIESPEAPRAPQVGDLEA